MRSNLLWKSPSKKNLKHPQWLKQFQRLASCHYEKHWDRIKTWPHRKAFLPRWRLSLARDLKDGRGSYALYVYRMYNPGTLCIHTSAEAKRISYIYHCTVYRYNVICALMCKGFMSFWLSLALTCLKWLCQTWCRRPFGSMFTCQGEDQYLKRKHEFQTWGQ